MITAQDKLRTDYITDAATIHPFRDWPLQPDMYSDLLQARRAFPVDRECLVSVLRDQYVGVEMSAQVSDNLEALLRPDTFTVVTGHQVVLMGGPLYTLYKTLTAIRLAEEIQAANPGTRVVPVFWMATEDHDFEEVNHFFKDYLDKRSYEVEVSGPVGRHVLQDEIRGLLRDIPETFARCYQPGKSMAEAFRRLLRILFDRYGLIVLDADNTALKRRFIPVMRADLRGELYPALEAGNLAFTAAGYPEQIRIRQGNLFYMTDGRRERMDPEAGGYRLAESGEMRSLSDLEAELEVNPERFSPNVALRPLYQESILPNLAYVGGWAEVAYWMQIKEAFQEAKVFYPAVWPRNRKALVDLEALKEWEAIGFTVADLERSVPELKEAFLLHHETQPAEFARELDRMREAFSRMINYMKEEDEGLGRSLMADQARFNRRKRKLERNYFRILMERNPEPYTRILELKAKISPDGYVQERRLNLTALGTVDIERCIDQLYGDTDPTDFKLKWCIL